MRCLPIALLFVACFLNQTPSADAGWNEFWAQSHLDYKRNKAWPQPWIRMDQIAVRQTFSPMVQRGWQMQNTVSAEHFEAGTGNLNPAGIAKLKSILRHTPPAYRTVYLFSDFGESNVEQHMVALQSQLQNWIPGGQVPQVVVTNVKPKGVSGTYADTISENFQNSMPAPTIGVKASDD